MIQSESNLLADPRLDGAPAHKALVDAAMDRRRHRRVLSISAFAEDHDSLRRILFDPEWRLTEASSCCQAMQFLCRDRAEVIVCDAHLPDGAWSDILSQIAELTDPPWLVVTDFEAGEGLRAQVRALGGYDILAKPFVAEQVRHVISAASHPRGVVAAPATAA